MTVDPARIVTVADYTAETVAAIAEHLEVTTSLDHLVYREAELDALYSILDMEVRDARESQAADLARLESLLAAATEAHDLAADDDPAAAAARLRDMLQLAPKNADS